MNGRIPPIPLAAAAVALLWFLLPGMVGEYGYFIDELYYLSCSARLAWGYVDHPPLAPFVLWIARQFLGDGLLALRLPAALAGALTVGAAGLLARTLGGGRLAQALACGAVMSGPVFMVMFGFFSMNALEILLWTACCGLLVVMARRDDDRLWLAFGALAGIGLLNKHTMVLLAAGLGVGVMLTPARRWLASRYLWLGALLAGVIFLPNVIWQVANDWPSLEFYRNAAMFKNVRVSAGEVLFQQIAFTGPGSLPLSVAGIVYLLRDRKLRHLGLLPLALLAMAMTAGQSRPDRISGMYPLLFAAGAVGIERLAAARVRWLAVVVPAWMLVFGVALAPLGAPILAPETAARYAAWLGIVPQIERGEGKRTQLPQWFADRLGWEDLVRDVAAVRDALPAAERADLAFSAPSYGQAGALEWVDPDAGLRPVFATHNNWFLWGPPERRYDVVIVVGNNRESLEHIYEQVDLAMVHECGLCMPWRNDMPIWVARHPKVDIAEFWPDWKSYE